MSIITQLDENIELARQQGYHVRFDWFGGTGGGVCAMGGKRHLFIDLALTPIEQLELLRKILDSDPSTSINRAA